jgi:hypothetical protein
MGEVRLIYPKGGVRSHLVVDLFPSFEEEGGGKYHGASAKV